MLSKIKKYIKKKIQNFLGMNQLFEKLDKIKFELGKLELEHHINHLNNIDQINVSVFSQNEEDGIIQYIIKKIDIKNHFFIELGCSDYEESNTRFLLKNNDWSGIIIDGSKENINKIKNSYYYWKKNINALSCFIDQENILQIFEKYCPKNLGLLSIDLDGNDYWILKKIIENGYSSDIIICEYNSLLGKEKSITQKYSRDFIRKNNNKIVSYGASIKAFHKLLQTDYKPIHGNKLGNNVFFVHRKHTSIEEKEIFKCYKESNFDELSSKTINKLSHEDQKKNILIQNFIEV